MKNVLIKADPFVKDLLVKSDRGEILNSDESAELSRIRFYENQPNRAAESLD